MPKSDIYRDIDPKAPASFAYYVWDTGWQHPRIARRVMCPDGRRRTVMLKPEADTAFSWPGSVVIAGKRVQGGVTARENPDGYDLEFIACWGK